MTTRPPSDSSLPDGLEDTLARSSGTDAERVLRRLIELGWTVAVAESLTGGQVVSAMVDVPGASQVVRGGIVAYATDLKHTLLGVDSTLLDAYGPVHPRVAWQMAEGVRHRLGQDDDPCHVGISTTGIAGPDSPDGQTVGTVHIGVATPLGTHVTSFEFRGSRAHIRAMATRQALRAALEVL